MNQFTASVARHDDMAGLVLVPPIIISHTRMGHVVSEIGRPNPTCQQLRQWVKRGHSCVKSSKALSISLILN